MKKAPEDPDSSCLPLVASRDSGASLPCCLSRSLFRLSHRRTPPRPTVVGGVKSVRGSAAPGLSCPSAAGPPAAPPTAILGQCHLSKEIHSSPLSPCQWAWSHPAASLVTAQSYPVANGMTYPSLTCLWWASLPPRWLPVALQVPSPISLPAWSSSRHSHSMRQAVLLPVLL